MPGRRTRCSPVIKSAIAISLVSGSYSLSREAVNVGEVAEQVVHLLHRETERAGVTVRLEIAESAPQIEAVRDQIHQVMLNLSLNAIHASQPGGSILVSIDSDGSLAEPTGVRIRFQDAGEGISQENLERIFDPFFTTKDPDQGTGLGLMISHQIVADHGGSIEVESTPGEGATFHVRLPSKPPATEVDSPRA